MLYTIDISKVRFDSVDVSESTIVDFFCPRKLLELVQFTAWGVTLLLSPKWNRLRPPFEHPISHDGKPCTRDMYVSGICTFKIDKIIGGYIELTPYCMINKNPRIVNCAQNPDGENLKYKRSWNMNNVDSADEYLWECTCAWPHGGFVLYLYSNGGTATLEFNSEDMVDADLYIMNPHRYAYREDRVLIESPVPRAAQRMVDEWRGHEGTDSNFKSNII